MANDNFSAGKKKKQKKKGRKVDAFGAGEKTGQSTATDLKLQRKKRKARLDAIMKEMGVSQ